MRRRAWQIPSWVSNLRRCPFFGAEWWLRFFLVTKTNNGFFTKGFVEMIDREMAGIDREMARIDREMAGIDREMAGIDREMARKQKWIATMLLLFHFAVADANARL